jgi:hypothetical protein
MQYTADLEQHPASGRYCANLTGLAVIFLCACA